MSERANVSVSVPTVVVIVKLRKRIENIPIKPIYSPLGPLFTSEPTFYNS